MMHNVLARSLLSFKTTKFFMGKVYFDLRTLTFDLKNMTIRTIFHILDFIQVNNNSAEELVFHLQRLNILQIIKYFQI